MEIAAQPAGVHLHRVAPNDHILTYVINYFHSIPNAGDQHKGSSLTHTALTLITK